MSHLLIQTVFRPWLGEEYRVGEVATAEVEPLEVPARHRHQLPQRVRGLAVGVLIG
ncbi:hypothetical protein QCN29_20710 [Streptomyces sp. HNM0663]|uniref:Uncharacterized protein n=1 Tax=Streptomyces chengmaiensis TaxID=3040919 RepID=A0ABT6HR26_9ACTN|nr:hypothetical protein [Streptomyces chengmaiensis]MDH2391167.1 hypothetical protein [Streptomyces chengmaiensis]